MLQKAIDKVNELISLDMGSLVEDKKDRMRERVRLHIFGVFLMCSFRCSENGPRRRYLLVSRVSGTSTSERRWSGPRQVTVLQYSKPLLTVVLLQGMFVKYIQQETNTRVQIKGLGSGFVDQDTGHEHDEPMYIHVT